MKLLVKQMKIDKNLHSKKQKSIEKFLISANFVDMSNTHYNLFRKILKPREIVKSKKQKRIKIFKIQVVS